MRCPKGNIATILGTQFLDIPEVEGVEIQNILVKQKALHKRMQGNLTSPSRLIEKARSILFVLLGFVQFIEWKSVSLVAVSDG